jgi:D-3-phosphoglycerate dehydrogenase / 2-oxoglutarate reductase
MEAKELAPGRYPCVLTPTPCGRQYCKRLPERDRSAEGRRSTTTITVAVLGTRYADLSIEEAILGPHGVRFACGGGATSEEIVDVAGDAQVVLAGGKPRFDADVIERLTCLGIVRHGVGTDSIDLDAAARAGMWVAYVPDYGTDSVALHAVTLMLACVRRLHEADALVRRGGWGIDSLRPLRAPQSLTAGIVGLGRIGRRVAELLAPFGFLLTGYDPETDVAKLGLRAAASLEDLLAASDVISLHAPGRSDGRPLLGVRELGLLKRGSIVVNTARGSLIDEGALVAGLAREAPALAALDVFASEPPTGVFDEAGDKVILTPHMAWYTEESEIDLRTKAAREALRILEGLPPTNVATRPMDHA